MVKKRRVEFDGDYSIKYLCNLASKVAPGFFSKQNNTCLNMDRKNCENELVFAV